MNKIVPIPELENYSELISELSYDKYNDEYLLDNTLFSSLKAYNFDKITSDFCAKFTKNYNKSRNNLSSPDALMKITVNNNDYLLLIEFKNGVLERNGSLNPRNGNEIKKIYNKVGDSIILLSMMSEFKLSLESFNKTVKFILVYNEKRNGRTHVMNTFSRIRREVRYCDNFPRFGLEKYVKPRFYNDVITIGGSESFYNYLHHSLCII